MSPSMRAVVVAALRVEQVAVEERPKVWRLATRNTQNALIIMWTSIGVDVARGTRPSARPRSRIRSISSMAGLFRPASSSDSRDVLGVVDVLDADQPDEVRVRLVVVERQLGQAADRRAGSRWSTSTSARRRGCARRRARAPRCRAAPCRRSSSRSSAWSCGCAPRSRRRARPRSPARRTRAWPRRGSRCACARRRAAARAPDCCAAACHRTCDDRRSVSGPLAGWDN